jgi:DNA-binding SARP family transcriptional activator
MENNPNNPNETPLMAADDHDLWKDLQTRADHILGRSVFPILICLLGSFRVLKSGRHVVIHSQKAEMLLRQLGLQHRYAVPRELLLEALWPGHVPTLASQSLNSLIYSLRKSLGNDNHNNAPILHEDGYYRLNKDAGVSIDIARFEELVKAGDQCRHAGNTPAAIAFYARAAQLYKGDLCGGTDLNAVIERERLRAHFLTVLARLADYYFSLQDYSLCLCYAGQLLEKDACREDAHRLLMRCYVRRGERAQALRQYHLCAGILRAEFHAVLEQDTTHLYDQIRLNPESV